MCNLVLEHNVPSPSFIKYDMVAISHMTFQLLPSMCNIVKLA